MYDRVAIVLKDRRASIPTSSATCASASNRSARACSEHESWLVSALTTSGQREALVLARSEQPSPARSFDETYFCYSIYSCYSHNWQALMARKALSFFMQDTQAVRG